MSILNNTSLKKAQKVAALLSHLGETDHELISEGWGDDQFFFANSSDEYLVLTDEEANEKAREYILDSLWAFNANFLRYFMPEGMTVEAIQAIQKEYEDAKEPLAALIGDKMDNLIDDAIMSDGRGHFMNTYDGREYDSGDFFVYRIS